MSKQQNKPKNREQVTNFEAIKMTLASPEQIVDWSFGEVTKAETINYRTFKPEPEGLFCEKIFGPTKNYECYCGKYKKVRYKGIICDKCGVEVTRKEVRRERMGHINLVVPVTHVWFAYGVPNKLSIVLDMSHKKLLAVIYYTRYMVISIEEERREIMAKRVAELMSQEKMSVDSELNDKVAELTAQLEADVKEVKESGADKTAVDFKMNQLDHDNKVAVAKCRHEFAQRSAEIDQFYSKLQETINRVEVGGILTEDEYIDLLDKDLIFFDARMGADAIEQLLTKLDLDTEIALVRQRVAGEKSPDKRMTLIKRLQYLEGFKKNRLKPDWMVLHVIPVIPPELRPIIPLSGGKFATNDLNDLYRRIINRNNRLKKLIEIGAPDVILRNEKRMLQEAVDALIDNQHRPGKAMVNGKKLPYSSLTDQLRGKKGIFRKNLLGKRVDYSGRAVIVGDATLMLDQCGLPKSVALEMFKPFVIQQLLAKDLAPNIKVAKDLIDEKEDIIWDILEMIIKDRPVLLNRAPTLHKYSIQAFYPRLVEGEAIRLHPLVCKAFNADFDGDQMAVHVLLTEDAIQEAKDKMMASKNIISVANGKMLAFPSKDMALGYFLMTRMKPDENFTIYANEEDSKKAYLRGIMPIDAEIVSRVKGKVEHTTIGRIILNEAFPADYPFVNKQLDGNEIMKIIEDIKTKYSADLVTELLDKLKSIGFKYATELGYSFSMSDCKIGLNVSEQIAGLEDKDKVLQENYFQGLVTATEKKKISVSMWNDFADRIAEDAWKALPNDNPVFEMVESKANGGKIQVRQVITIKGMVRDSEGNWVPLPIKGNYRDGLTAFEYFVSASGGRKGVADTALRTPSSGYLTRKLADVAHDVIVRQDDCGYAGEGLPVYRNANRSLSFEDRVYGRTLALDVKDAEGNVIATKGESVTRELAKKIDKSGIEHVNVRSVIYCNSAIGVCQQCYGYDIEQAKLVEMGKAVGIIAAQSIGEPGTQFTLRTFHQGGVQKTDMTQGLPRVEELFEARTPKAEAHIAKFEGDVKITKLDDNSTVINILGKKPVEKYFIINRAKSLAVDDGVEIKMGDALFVDYDGSERQSPMAGKISLDHGVLKIRGMVSAEETITVLQGFEVMVADGQHVIAGQQLTEGAIDPKEIAKVASIDKAQQYIINEALQVFNEQGVSLSDVHFEVIVRQMARLGRVHDSGDSDYVIGTLASKHIADIKNNKLRKDNKNIALVIPQLLGIKAASLYTESFLSAMSFQEQVRVLTNTAILGKVDYLRGMKENVILGRKIPTGEGARIVDEALLDEVFEESSI
jgi:DNA-directed RNA polymerase subunit beta'